MAFALHAVTVDRRLIHDGHVHRFIVVEDLEGWEVREEEDSKLIRQTHHDDWHRVERDTWRFELRSQEFKRQGWVEH
jgi:hypothetical protein